MVNIHSGFLRPRGHQQHKPMIFPMILGFLLGSVVMFVFMAPRDQPLPSSSLLHHNASGHTPGNNAPNHPPGWHAIMVYFGTTHDEFLQPDEEDKWFSQVHQDEVVVDLLGHGGYFVDLAANDAKEHSNTLALEQRGWTGLCIEPNDKYWYGLSHRKCTVVGALVGGPESQKVQVKFRGVYGGIVGAMDNRLANRKKEPSAPTVTRYTAPFHSILTLYQVPKVIDYLSLDVEGSEMTILQHFPFSEYIIRVLTIERPSKELRQLLQDNGYLFLKDLAWWGETLWCHSSTGFTPDHPNITKIPFAGKN